MKLKNVTFGKGKEGGGVRHHLMTFAFVTHTVNALAHLC